MTKIKPSIALSLSDPNVHIRLLMLAFMQLKLAEGDILQPLERKEEYRDQTFWVGNGRSRKEFHRTRYRGIELDRKFGRCFLMAKSEVDGNVSIPLYDVGLLRGKIARAHAGNPKDIRMLNAIWKANSLPSVEDARSKANLFAGEDKQLFLELLLSLKQCHLIAGKLDSLELSVLDEIKDSVLERFDQKSVKMKEYDISGLVDMTSSKVLLSGELHKRYMGLVEDFSLSLIMYSSKLGRLRKSRESRVAV